MGFSKIYAKCASTLHKTMMINPIVLFPLKFDKAYLFSIGPSRSLFSRCLILVLLFTGLPLLAQEPVSPSGNDSLVEEQKPRHPDELKDESSSFTRLKEEVLELKEKIAKIEEEDGIIPDLGFRAHKSNYVLPFTWTNPVEDRLTHEIKFQFSLRQQIVAFEHFRLFYAYSQKSFFQVYDSKNSRPFRESNYNPELFVRSPNFVIQDWGKWYFDFGYEHESNGMRVPASRSWDRLIVRVNIQHGPYTILYKNWYRYDEPEKKDPTDPHGDDNPDLEKFYGHEEVTLAMDWRHYHFSATGRYSFRHHKGGIEANMTFPAFGKIRGLIQYWDGYGESLIDYNRHLNKIGVGFQFTQ